MHTNNPFREPNSELPAPFLVACKEFNARFKNDSECIEELLQILGERHIYCRNCNSKNVRRSFGSRTLICNDCRRGSSAFTDTVFDGIKKPRAWLLCHWLLARGIAFNSNQFHYPARVAYSSALTIVKKLAYIIKSDLEKEVELIESNMFVSIFTRRSFETPSQNHPRAEQDEMEKSAAYLEDVEEDRFLDEGPAPLPQSFDELRQIDKDLFAILTDEKQHFDHLIYKLNCSVSDLCHSIFNLDVIGLINRHPGDWYTLKQKDEIKKLDPALSATNPLVRDFVDFIRQVHKGVSRKCLNLYLAIFWNKANRVRWNRNTLNKACSEHPPIKEKEVLSYVSPLIVNLMAATILS